MTDTEDRNYLLSSVAMMKGVSDHYSVQLEAATPEAGSDLAVDDAAIQPMQASVVIGHCFALASDMLATAVLVIDDEGGLRLPVFGMYPLLRSAIEGSALAVWLMQPDDPIERRARALGVRWSDVIYDDAAIRVSMAAKASDDNRVRSFKQDKLRTNAIAVTGRKAKLRGLAADLGVTIDERSGKPGFGPLLESISLDMDLGPGDLRGPWHYVSGVTHPSVSRSLLLSDVEYLPSAEESMRTARVTASMSTVTLAANAAVTTYLEAVQLFELRGGLEGLTAGLLARFPTRA